METKQTDLFGVPTKANPDVPTEFIYYEDAGHGWLQVPMPVLKAYGLTDKISEFSYRKGDMAYLEEDDDASTFIKAWLVDHGFKETDYKAFPYKRDYEDWSWIRKLRHYYR